MIIEHIMHQARPALRLSRGQPLFASDSNMVSAAAPRRTGGQHLGLSAQASRRGGHVKLHVVARVRDRCPLV